jgi:hypothetical protein
MREPRPLIIFIVFLFMFSLSAGTSRAHWIFDNLDGAVTDIGTGLMWQKADDGTRRNWADAVTYCESLVLANHDDWRAPRIDELETIINYAVYLPASYDPPFVTRSAFYWSSSTYVGNSDYAWRVGFDGGFDGVGHKTLAHSYSYVRCVRGGPFWPLDTSDHLETFSPYTVQDTYWGYMWQTGDSGDTMLSWDQANAYCDNLELDGYTDWRSPEIEALVTIFNYTTYDSALSTIFDPRRPHTSYWSGSTYVGVPDYAWLVESYGGGTWQYSTVSTYPVRCVRGGPGPFAALTLSKSGSGTGTVTSDPTGIDCESSCIQQSGRFGIGTQVTLNAIADAGSTFTGWSGVCGGTGDCIVTMNEVVNVTVEFAKQQPAFATLTLSKSGSGTGTVTSDPAGIYCDTACPQQAAQFSWGAEITLTATADPPATFNGWTGGGCSGTSQCVASLSEDITVIAEFVDNSLPPNVPIDLPQTGQTTCYDATGVAIICIGGTGQDGEIRAGIPWPNPRFESNGDGTATDKLTGLIWTENANAPGPIQCPTGIAMSWQGALDYVKCLNNNSYLSQTDWRLPNLNEISSFMHAGEANLSTWLNSSGFNSVQQGYYWSSTPEWEHTCKSSMGRCSLDAWVFGMGDGSLDFGGVGWSGGYIWPVRGGIPCLTATVCLPQTYQSICYKDRDYDQEEGVPSQIPCTGTGQDGEIRAGVAWPNPPFVTNADGTTTDNLTGIVWAKSVGDKIWQGGLNYVNNLNASNYLGHSDWRLPNVLEWRTKLFPGVSVWTSDTLISNPAAAWRLRSPAAKSDRFYVIPIRGGQFVSYSTVDVSPPSYDFGYVTLGKSVAKTFSIVNNGTATLLIGWISLSPTSGSPFEIKVDNCSDTSIAPTGSCTMEVTCCTPTPAGPKSASLVIQSNALFNSSASVPLTATVIAPAVNVSPSSFDFGSAISGTTGTGTAPKQFTISNTGLANLVLGTLSLNGTNYTQFILQQDLCSGQTLSPEETCTVDVYFKPTTTGSKTADLTIPSNDPFKPKLKVALSGTGVVLLTPTALQAKPISESENVLTWKDNSNNETGFKVERKAGVCGSTSSWSQVTEVGANVNTFTETGLSPRKTYAYRVRAYNATGTSAYSGCVTAKTGIAGTPAAPSGLIAQSVSATEIDLTWQDNSVTETSYEIYRKVGSEPWSLLTTTIAGVTTFNDPAATGNAATTGYSYYIRACNINGCSPPTNKAVIPLAPITLNAINDGKSKITLNWADKSVNETGFQLYKKEGYCTSTNAWVLLTDAILANKKVHEDKGLTYKKTYAYRVRAFYRTTAQPYAYGYSDYTNCDDAQVNK